MAMPHLIPFPVKRLPQATDPLPEGLDVWDVDSPLEQVDWFATFLTSPVVIPGVTTRERFFGGKSWVRVAGYSVRSISGYRLFGIDG
jgi:hypothetical protein